MRCELHYTIFRVYYVYACFVLFFAVETNTNLYGALYFEHINYTPFTTVHIRCLYAIERVSVSILLSQASGGYMLSGGLWVRVRLGVGFSLLC